MWHFTVEDELAEAYNATKTLEKDLKKLVSISEMLVEKYKEFEERIEWEVQEKEELSSDIGYLQVMYDQVRFHSFTNIGERKGESQKLQNSRTWGRKWRE